jgi:hypothetical protein
VEATTLLKQWDKGNSGALKKSVFLKNMSIDPKYSGDSKEHVHQQIQLVLFVKGTGLDANRFGTAFNLLFIAHSPISQTAFRWLDCRSVGDPSLTNNKFLHADYSIECYGALHNNYLPLTVLMIVVYSVGIPLMFAVYLFRHRSKSPPVPVGHVCCSCVQLKY